MTDAPSALFATAYDTVPPQHTTLPNQPSKTRKQRGKQFQTAPPKQGQTSRAFSSFVTAATGDPYQDKWKLMNQHYTRSAPTGATSARRRGILVGGGQTAGPLSSGDRVPPHMAEHGHTVSIPTRKPETHEMYVPESRPKAASTGPRTRGGSRTLRRHTKPTLVDDYTAQEKLRKQMVMGMGSGCRGASTKNTVPQLVSAQSFRLSAKRSPALFDEYVNAELLEHGSAEQSHQHSPPSHLVREHNQLGKQVQPFRPGGLQAAERYVGVAGTKARAGAHADNAHMYAFGATKHAGVEVSPYTRGRVRTKEGKVLSQRVQQERGPWRGPWRGANMRAPI
jgi:hypothetical protein